MLYIFVCTLAILQDRNGIVKYSAEYKHKTNKSRKGLISMKVLVVNAGSSSLKYQLFDTSSNEVLAKGICERIGIDGAIDHKLPTGEKYKEEIKEVLRRSKDRPCAWNDRINIVKMAI